MNVLSHLDLCSGIGGFALGLERTGGFRSIGFCEIDPFCREVLSKHWPGIPIHKDIRGLSTDAIGTADIITAGYPCQPYSHAGKRRGTKDDRHIWGEVHRIVAAVRPRWCLFENVPGHISLGLDGVLADLEGEGYTPWPLVLPACAVAAPHRRERVWIVAHAAQDLPHRGGIAGQQSGHEPANRNPAMANATTQPERKPPDETVPRATGGQAGNVSGGRRPCWPDGQGRAPEPGLGGGIDGLSAWLDGSWEEGIPRVSRNSAQRTKRLSALGNAVVPQIVQVIGEAILATDRAERTERTE